MKPIRLVCGTRSTQAQFAEESALGRSLKLYDYVSDLQLQLFDENRTGLSTIYNRAIEQAKTLPAILVFIHDDISICDFHWIERIREGLQAFDIIGLAGNTRRMPRQPSWAFTPEMKWDQREFLSGTVGHGDGFPANVVSYFGPAGQACKLLDGLLLAADSERLVESGLRFDEQFDFHFYDLDFCRQAELKGLTMGTWPISVVHQSGGAYGKPDWRAAYERYLSKYGERAVMPSATQPAAPPIETGQALLQAGRLTEAAAVFRQILAVRPNHADALHLLGLVAYYEGRYGEAADLIMAALGHQTSEIFYGNLGNAFAGQGKRAAAIECFRQAIALKPDYVQAHNNLGNLLREQSDFPGAVRCFRTVIALKPDYAEAHNNLANALVDLGELDAAIQAYRHAIALKPDLLEARSNLLFILSYREDFDQSAYLADAVEFGRIAMTGAKPWRNWLTSTEPQRAAPLRVGLVSGDLKTHPTGHFLESILAHLDRSRIELVAYPTRNSEDALTQRIKPHFSAWTPLSSLSDEQAAARIRDDRIDLLLDLSGHMNFNRLPLFAWRPAPVQASWLGYFASTGLPAMDYLLGDPHVLPPDAQTHYTERLRHLPDSYLCFTPPAERVDVGPLPLSAQGHVTFGCFNHLMKMNDSVVDVWTRILHAVPGSRLFLKAKQLDDTPTRETTIARFAARGIDASRLILEGRSPRAEYFAAYNRIDIALSPFPYPGGTTSVEGLWMGVPVLCLRGDRFLSNICTSMLHSAGLPEWIAKDSEEYVAKAVAFAADVPRLAALRTNLRASLLASPLCDAARYARHLEAALETMWRDGVVRSSLASHAIVA